MSADKKRGAGIEIPADRKNAYGYEDLLACARGELFDPEQREAALARYADD